jgi:hypothetical protein
LGNSLVTSLDPPDDGWLDKFFAQCGLPDAASLDAASLDAASLGAASLDVTLLGAASLGAASLGAASLGTASLDAASLGAASLDDGEPPFFTQEELNGLKGLFDGAPWLDVDSLGAVPATAPAEAPAPPRKRKQPTRSGRVPKSPTKYDPTPRTREEKQALRKKMRR